MLLWMQDLGYAKLAGVPAVNGLCELKFWIFHHIHLLSLKWWMTLHYEMTLAQNGSLCFTKLVFLSCLCNRFKFCAAPDLRGAWKFSRHSHRSCSCGVTLVGNIVEARSQPFKRANHLLTPSFHCHIFRRHFPGWLGNSEVSLSLPLCYQLWLVVCFLVSWIKWSHQIIIIFYTLVVSPYWFKVYWSRPCFLNGGLANAAGWVLLQSSYHMRPL